MSDILVSAQPHASPVAPFTPKLLSSLRLGYTVGDLRADAMAGLTVSIVALPLSMAIAIASDVSPDRGLVTAVVGGLLVSALGGSRFQIGGPAGAFIVVVSTTMARYGAEGLAMATFLSGVLMVVAGYLRLGTFIRHVPHPVIVGFTAAIGLIIFLSQIKDLIGLRPPGHDLLYRMSFSPAAAALAFLTIAAIVTIRRVRPRWPAFFLTIIALSAAGLILHLPVETIGSRFGALPRTLPIPRLPHMTFDMIAMLLPTAASFALLGSIESLLSASVADVMSGGRHRSNCELVAQGVANMAAPLFGGFCVTGTIARTATNVRSGARSPVSGIFCALFILAFMLVGAPLASYVPLCVLAAVLSVVAWTMADIRGIWRLIQSSKTAAAIMIATFLLVAFRDLSEGIIVGCAFAWVTARFSSGAGGQRQSTSAS